MLGGNAAAAAVSREASSTNMKRDDETQQRQQQHPQQPSSLSSTTSKPSLSLSFESSPTLSIGNGSPFMPWQQPYSELSRFPSASYRFRPPRDLAKDWPPEGSQYMTPLPSPSVQSRSRSTSDAASETSIISETTSTTSSKPGGGGGGGSSTTSRSKTMNFFQTADTAMSPPPPPRMRSADYDHKKKEDWTPSAGSSASFAFFHTNSPPRTSTSTSIYPSNRLSTDTTAAKTDGSASPASFDSSASIPPLSNLPSGFRSEYSQPRSITTTTTSTPADTSSSSHRRMTSAGSMTFTPSALGKNSSMIDSPLASPTESQNIKWTKEPPSRLPTLMTDHDHSQSSSSNMASPSSGRSSQIPLSSLSIRDPLNSNGSTSNGSSSTDLATTPASECEPGTVLKGRYEVVRHLGLGSFSRVVLAKRLAANASDSDDAATTRRNHQRMPSGPYPTSLAKGHLRSLSKASAAASESEKASSSTENLVAIKLISRSHIKKNDRMRISIVREVEVLKHIRHPSLVHLTSSFETPWHTCLVLEYAAGGELFDFIANHHEHTSEALVRRIFGELADVLGWMHSIGLVHRDIKLENILLTCNPFASGAPAGWPEPSSLPPIPTPLVKLTDFGLSRFVDLSSPYLETRCGSEEYAAPELIMGKRYDGRQTDAWALGVVLYALIVGHLPFVEDVGGDQSDAANRSQISPSSRGSMRSRKAYLLKIAKGEYSWPLPEAGPSGESIQRDDTRMINERSKALVGGLLTRDPKKRLRTEDIWDLDWMSGPGMPEKRFVKGGGLEGVALTAFERDDEAMVRAEVPDPG